MPWAFRDFVNEGGKNVIHDWLTSRKGRQAKADLNTFLTYLAAQDKIHESDISARRGYSGLLELRIKINRVQHRPLCFYGPRQSEITLLIMAIEKGFRLDPVTADDTAMERKKL